jgi:hypothetical protein
MHQTDGNNAVIKTVIIQNNTKGGFKIEKKCGFYSLKRTDVKMGGISGTFIQQEENRKKNFECQVNEKGSPFTRKRGNSVNEEI